jgi:hypothetical protein
MTKQQVHFETLGYEPMRTKPVHLVTTFFASVTGRTYRNELLNKVAIVKHKKGLQKEYSLETLYSRLRDEGKLDEGLTAAQFDLLRRTFHALFNNDQAMNAAFRPYSTFGNDYTAASARFLGRFNRMDGYAGTFLHEILDCTKDGKKILKFALEVISTETDAFTRIAKPVLDQEPADAPLDLVSEYEQKLGVLSEKRKRSISSLMKDETAALVTLCANLLEHESVYSQLRYLVIGLGAWLLRYLLKTASDRRPTIFLDFSDKADSRLRAQSRSCYNRHYNSVLELYATRNDNNQYETDIEKEGLFRKRGARMNDYSVLGEHFSDLCLRMGFSQPRSGTASKHFELQPDTLRTLVWSIVPPQAIQEIGDFSRNLRTIWGMVFGGGHDDRRYLRDDGFAGIDEDDLFVTDRGGFISLAKRLNMATEPSDGLVLMAGGSEVLP